MMAQGLGPLLPMWETQVEFLVLGFGLAQTQLFQAFGE